TFPGGRRRQETRSRSSDAGSGASSSRSPANGLASSAAGSASRCPPISSASSASRRRASESRGRARGPPGASRGSKRAARRRGGGAAQGVEELNRSGRRAREGVDALAAFLDRAARAGLAEVRVIHGVGSGALRRALHEYLSTSPYCASFHGAEPERGGAGVTIAVL